MRHREWEASQEKKDDDGCGDRNVGIASLLFRTMDEELRSNIIKENQATSSAPPLSDAQKMKNAASMTAQSLLADSSIQSNTKLQQALQNSIKLTTMVGRPGEKRMTIAQKRRELKGQTGMLTKHSSSAMASATSAAGGVGTTNNYRPSHVTFLANKNTQPQPAAVPTLSTSKPSNFYRNGL